MSRAAALALVCALSVSCSGSKAPTSASPTPTPTTSLPAAPATFALSGTVTDQQTGRGIASALARIFDGKNANKAAVTDASVAYAITGLEAGDFTLDISASGYATVSQKVSLHADTRAGAVLIAASRAITGTVTDATSRGVLPNIQIAVLDGPSAGQSTRSDGAGNYTLTGVSSASTQMQASATSYLTANVSIPTGTDVRRDIVMTRTSAPNPPPVPAPPPTAPTPPAGGVVITFDGVGTVSNYNESGFTFTTTAASWFVSTYGKPGPSIQFQSPAGASLDGEVRITSGGATYRFLSVDVYSSTTAIPYTFTGLRGGSTVFSVTGRQGNTFGAFATVASGQSATAIDTLLIRLTNSCCTNPMGIDNVVLLR